MSGTSVTVLAAIAGLTIFLGLPVGRIHGLSSQWRAFLNASAIGILLFLLVDVLSHAVEPVESTLLAATDHGASWLRFTGLAATLVVGLGVGLMSLVFYQQRVIDPSGTPTDPIPRRVGPGAASAASFPKSRRLFQSPVEQLALMIAIGIGLHNFSEGLAIGQSAASGEVRLALLLIVGFGLHNATEGFGIVAPLSAEQDRPSWKLLFVLGLIGGGPTFLGTLIGQVWVNDFVYVAFLALAAGSILYVVVQLLRVAQRLGYEQILMWGLLAGLVAGFATDFIVAAGGG